MRDKKNRKNLRSKFENGDRPSEKDFADLIDGVLNQKSDRIFGVNHKIGIGTENPTAPLEVAGINKEGRQSFVTSDGGGSIFRVAHPHCSGVALGSDRHEPLMLGSFYGQEASFDPQMTISSEGNVGVGIEQPKEKLEVKGSVKIEDKLLLGQGELTIEKSSLLLTIDGKTHRVKLEKEHPKPLPPKHYSGIMIVLMTVLSVVLIGIFWELLNK